MPNNYNNDNNFTLLAHCLVSERIFDTQNPIASQKLAGILLLLEIKVFV